MDDNWSTFGISLAGDDKKLVIQPYIDDPKNSSIFMEIFDIQKRKYTLKDELLCKT